MSPHRHHEAVRSELIRGEMGRLSYRARCSCGWMGEPVDGSEVVASWDSHFEAIYGDHTSAGTEGVDLGH